MLPEDKKTLDDYIGIAKQIEGQIHNGDYWSALVALEFIQAKDKEFPLQPLYAAVGFSLARMEGVESSNPEYAALVKVMVGYCKERAGAYLGQEPGKN
jgi:hypothetical protein